MRSVRFAPLVVFILGLGVQRAGAQGSPEELALYVARAQDLAREMITDATPRIGVLMLGIGPSSAVATDVHGRGHFSLALGGRGAGFTVTNPDYRAADPTGADQIDAGVGAVYGDASVGLLYRDHGGRTTVLGSLDLLLRLGLTVGDQANIANRVDLGKLKRMIGAGVRVGLLAGRHVPQVSLSLGVNHLVERRFSVAGEVEGATSSVPYHVDLDFDETTYFGLLEVGKDLGFVAPYLAAGIGRHHLNSRYDAIIVFDADAPEQPRVDDTINVWSTRTLACGGFEFGQTVSLVCEGGVTEDGPFGSFYLRFRR